MWLPKALLPVLTSFEVSKEALLGMREENSALKAERDSLKTQVITTQANLAWMMLRMNSLENERAALLEKVAGITLPVPEVVKIRQTPGLTSELTPAIFEDMGDKEAKTLGLPIF